VDRRGWIFSGVLHGGVIAAAVLGLPSLFDADAEAINESIVVSMVAEEDVVGIWGREPELELEEPRGPKLEPEPKLLLKEVPENKLEPLLLEREQVEVKMPEAPLREPDPEPEPEYAVVEPEPLPEPEPEYAAVEPEPLPEPKPEPTVEETPPEPPLAKPEPEPKTAQDPPSKALAQVPKPTVKPKSNFDSLLKSVVEQERESELQLEPAFDKLLASVADEPTSKAEERDLPRPARAMSLALSNQIALVIKDRVEANWSVPAGVRDAGDLVVTIHIRLGRDGVVLSAEILDANYAEDPNFRTMAESARRAVQKASPIKALRRFGDDYSEWRDVTMTFRPPV